MATQIGPKIGIEGEKEYRQQIQNIIQQTKTLDSAMSKTASSAHGSALYTSSMHQSPPAHPPAGGNVSMTM